jgi:hypothetical protein
MPPMTYLLNSLTDSETPLGEVMRGFVVMDCAKVLDPEGQAVVRSPLKMGVESIAVCLINF